MTDRGKKSDRRLAEQAVRVMTASIHESRVDGKVPPRVGVVVVLEDGSVTTASRGELRNGDHAEFTALERKLRAQALDGSKLFTTLEPCAPGARSKGKLSWNNSLCADTTRRLAD